MTPCRPHPDPVAGNAPAQPRVADVATRRRRPLATGAALAALAGALTLALVGESFAQSRDAAAAREAFRQDRADCMAGRTAQSRQDCLYEARSVLRDRLAGFPDGASGAATGSAAGRVDRDDRGVRGDRN